MDTIKMSIGFKRLQLGLLMAAFLFASVNSFGQSGKKQKKKQEENLLQAWIVQQEPENRENLLLNLGIGWYMIGEGSPMGLLIDANYQVIEALKLNLNTVLPTAIDNRYVPSKDEPKYNSSFMFELGGSYAISDKIVSKEKKVFLGRERKGMIEYRYWAKHDRNIRQQLNARLGYKYHQEALDLGVDLELSLPEGNTILGSYIMHSIYIGGEYSLTSHFLASIEQFGVRNRSEMTNLYFDLILGLASSTYMVDENFYAFENTTKLGNTFGFRLGYERYARANRNMVVSRLRRAEVGALPVPNAKAYTSGDKVPSFYIMLGFGIGYDMKIE